jgi:hypothetical protein
MNVKTFLLNGESEEEICMKQLDGFVICGHEKKVCRSLKILYGSNKLLSNGMLYLMILWHILIKGVLITLKSSNQGDITIESTPGLYMTTMCLFFCWCI